MKIIVKNKCLIVTIILLIQGIVFTIFNQQYDYFNKYILTIKIFDLFFITISIFIIKILFNNKYDKLYNFKEEYDSFNNFKIE